MVRTAKAGRGRPRVTAEQLGGMLFPGCRTLEDVEAALKAECNATSRNLWTCARRLMTVLGCDDVLELYSRHREVVAWIESAEAPPASASKMTFYSSLAALANPDRMLGIARHVPPSARLRYLKRASAMSRAVREEHAQNRLDPRERAAILPWPNIVSAYRRHRDALSDSQRVIAALYLAGGDNPAGAPRRLDYNAVRVFHRKPPPSVSPNLNYIVVHSPTEVDLVLQEFKTRKHYGPYNARLPAAVSRVIHESLRRRPRDWLLHDSAGLPLTPSGFGRRLTGTLKRLTGRPIGASNLRKSFITWLYSREGVPRRRLEEYAKAMNHSPAEQRSYRRKNIASTATSPSGAISRKPIKAARVPARASKSPP